MTRIAVTPRVLAMWGAVLVRIINSFKTLLSVHSTSGVCICVFVDSRGAVVLIISSWIGIQPLCSWVPYGTCSTAFPLLQEAGLSLGTPGRSVTSLVEGLVECLD